MSETGTLTLTWEEASAVVGACVHVAEAWPAIAEKSSRKHKGDKDMTDYIFKAASDHIALLNRVAKRAAVVAEELEPPEEEF